MTIRVIMRANGQRYEGWESVRLKFGIEQLAATFSLSLAEKGPGGTDLFRIRAGDHCEISFADSEHPDLGEPSLLEGWIDDSTISYSSDTHSLGVSGRCLLGDLVDCSAGVYNPGRLGNFRTWGIPLSIPREWTDQGLEAIIKDVIQPFGGILRPLSVQVGDVDIGEPFRHVAVQEGETIAELIFRLCRQRAILPISYGDGRIVLTRAGSMRTSESLVYGQNIKSGRIHYNFRDRFSDYIFKGQAQGGENLQLEDYVSPSGAAYDDGMGRYRPMSAMAENQGDAGSLLDRAKWESTVRAGKSLEATYTVQGWLMSIGYTWTHNQIITVTDPNASLDKTDRLIASTTFLMDESGGTRTELKLVHPDTFKLLPASDGAGEIDSMEGAP